MSGFVVRPIDGRSTPLAICGSCREPISIPGMAAVVFDMREQHDRQPILAHKGNCHDTAEGRIRDAGGFPGWTEFGVWMAQLLHNSNLLGPALEHAIESSETLHELGL